MRNHTTSAVLLHPVAHDRADSPGRWNLAIAGWFWLRVNEPTPGQTETIAQLLKGIKWMSPDTRY